MRTLAAVTACLLRLSRPRPLPFPAEEASVLARHLQCRIVDRRIRPPAVNGSAPPGRVSITSTALPTLPHWGPPLPRLFRMVPLLRCLEQHRRRHLLPDPRACIVETLTTIRAVAHTKSSCIATCSGSASPLRYIVYESGLLSLYVWCFFSLFFVFWVGGGGGGGGPPPLQG